MILREMPISFSEQFRSVCQPILGITEELVRESINIYDCRHIEDNQCFFLTFHKVQNQHLLVISRSNLERKLVIDMALWILPELITETKSCNPYKILQALIQKVGLVMHIGDQVNRLIKDIRVPIKMPINDQSFEPLDISIANPQYRKFWSSFNTVIEEKNGKYFLRFTSLFCFDIVEYLIWVTRGTYHPDVEVYIDPRLDSLTVRNLIDDGLFSIVMKANVDQEGILWRIKANDFYFEMGISNGCVYLVRNKDKIEVPPILSITNEPCRFTFEWSADRLSGWSTEIGEGNTKNKRKKRRSTDTVTCRTPVTHPPNKLLDWIRQQMVFNTVRLYGSREQFYRTVQEMVNSLQDKVQRNDILKSFWDTTKEGKRIVKTVPKDEPTITPLLASLLEEIASVKHIEITPERPLAGGKLDLLFSGVLYTGEKVHICVEVKHAHSNKLLHGLTHQLPEYMRAIGCDRGIYLVLCFKGEGFDEPAQYDNGLDLFLSLDKALSSSGRKKQISISLLDLSKRKSPSRK